MDEERPDGLVVALDGDRCPSTMCRRPEGLDQAGQRVYTPTGGRCATCSTLPAARRWAPTP